MNGDASAELILIANPGSASRKYGLFKDAKPVAQLHFEYEDGAVVCRLVVGDEERRVDAQIASIDQAPARALAILQEQGLGGDTQLRAAAVPLVAPGAYFLEDRLIDEECLEKLKAAKKSAPLHIPASLSEIAALKESLPDTPIYGISDSAFHITKPDYAWNYGIRLEDADRFDIKRFGYQGLSVGSVIHTLHKHEKLPPRVVVCHLGSGSSVSGVYHGKSFDTTMGYSPLEGLVMETRSGSLDFAAIKALQEALGLDDAGIEDYLNHQGGLLGISGISSDVRSLLGHESDGHHYAGLALKAYVHSVLKGIGQMSAVMGGVDVLIFTGVVGERSFVIRERIVEKLHYLDFMIDARTNKTCDNPKELTCVSRLAHSRPIFVVPANENTEIARRLSSIL